MNNTQENTTKVELESLVIEGEFDAKLHVYPYDPKFLDRSWSHDEDGNLHTYEVEVEITHAQDEDYDGNRFAYIDQVNVLSIQATDANGDNVVHTPNDHGRVLRWIENNYSAIDEQWDKEAKDFFGEY